ncbi:hypothetical protein FOT81_13740 [Raoultella planticola]|uniref:hypothetical protein n=1 Tax=Raoultella planticola TaxID=575 RepID=UPI0017864A36|nr:hypothetical protein [Raoultella planticola]EKW5591849.1 hypothetical protein [Raoultella planticola]MBE0092259.1 hypothetical protein [Raoultella planticola]
MSKQRKWRFVVEGAEKHQGGTYSGPRTGEFRIWYVTGGDGVKFRRCPYAPGGWKVKKNRTTYDDKPVEYVVKNPEDISALNAFVGEKPYAGYRRVVA